MCRALGVSTAAAQPCDMLTHTHHGCRRECGNVPALVPVYRTKAQMIPCRRLPDWLVASSLAGSLLELCAPVITSFAEAISTQRKRQILRLLSRDREP